MEWKRRDVWMLGIHGYNMVYEKQAAGEGRLKFSQSNR